MGSNDSVPKAQFIERVDESLFSELKDGNVNVMRLFYRIFGHLPKKTYILTGDATYMIDKPDNEDFNEADFVDLKHNETHNNIISDSSWVYRHIQYSNIYIKDGGNHCGTIVLLEAVTLSIWTDCEDEVEYIRNAIVKKDKEDDDIVMGILSRSNGDYIVADMVIDKMDIDIDATYNDDLPIDEIDKFITKDNMGLALFHGAHGTGKSTFIQYLVQKYTDKRFIVLDTDILLDSSADSLLNLFTENMGAIYIIEDCEKLLKSREESYNPTITVFLNMTDGLLGKAIKSKFICTFNTGYENIDEAIKRKGRMKVRYEFKELCKEKVHAINPAYNEEMTVAELFNSDDNDFSPEKKSGRIGFGV